jgi:ABC-type amino acid transport system permease subunit
MPTELWNAISGTVALWAVSGSLAVGIALLLSSGSLSSRRPVRAVARSMVNLTRGVPTSLLVIAAGIAMIRLPAQASLPRLYPGTPASFQHVAWGVSIALALGSAGHLAQIFQSAREALGPSRLDEAKALGLSSSRQGLLIARECAAIALGPTGTRLVHHLHNTAFAALFPIIEVFGYVQEEANATFRVLEFALLGCGVYVALSGLIWLAFRSAEAALQHRLGKGPATVPGAWRLSWS